MSYAENLWIFFILLFGIIIVPGMDMLFVLANALTGGRQAGLSATGGVMFGGAILALQMIVRCPKCKARLGRTIAMPVAFGWRSGPRVNFCPFCGVKLDEPIPHPESATQSLNPIR